MQDLDKELQRLTKPEPSAKFCRQAKARLMNKICLYENETWFARLLRKISPVMPSEHFIQTAKIRLMARIGAAKQPFLNWLVITKRLVASTLIMTLAVTSVLFFTGGKQPVSASDTSYIEILAGSVTIKHSDQLIWDVVTKQTELSEGDLIQLGNADSAVIHFFDDTQMRLDGDSLLLISRMGISPGYSRQGVIETSLHKGKAWVQTLNVDDGQALFTMMTPDALISTTNASFDVQAGLTDPTVIRVFRHNVDVNALQFESQKVFATGKLNSFQEILLDSPASYKNTVELAAFTPVIDISDNDRNEKWVLDNLQADRDHLTQLRERELASIKAATGALPGNMFYSLKRAKETLSLALSFNREDQASLQIDMANQRLSESIVLIEQGETEKAKQALAEYQDLVRQITDEKKPDIANLDQLSNRIVAAHQKALIAALPSDAQIVIVKQVLDETQEMLAEDPIKKADIRLNSSLEDLVHIQDYIASGDLVAAQNALVNHLSPAASLMAEVTDFQNDDQKKEFYSNILEKQNEEKRLLVSITNSLTDMKASEDMVKLAKSADRKLDDSIKYITDTVQPILPGVVATTVTVVNPADKKLDEFVDKVNIYSTFTGQKNQINRLFEQYPQYAKDTVFLTKLRDQLDARGKDIVNVKLLQLKKDVEAAKSKRIKLKIERAKQQMKMRVDN